MYKEENQRLKDYMNALNKENENLKLAQEQADNAQVMQAMGGLSKGNQPDELKTHKQNSGHSSDSQKDRLVQALQRKLQ